jgi:type I restriction enzyme M protein
LAKKSDGKWQSKVGRDILFIERNLDFLKPGGRMGIVLPQGRFNNSSDKNIRDYLAERCRILAVVGLHGNTFKPHTGTKTSVLFVQKWNDDPKAGALCPRKDDYNIFFATMRKSGKDNSGEKIWRRVYASTDSLEDDASVLNPPSPVERRVGMEGDFLQDVHGHLVVDHDLYNHEGLTEDGIAEAFVEFAKKEELSFFKSSPSVTPFDAERYQRLMDGLEAAELSLSYVQSNNISVRVDAEFFQKEYIATARKLASKQTQFLAQIANKIDVGHVGSMVSEYDETGILLLQTRNVQEFFINTEGCKRITQNFHNQLIKSQIVQGNILIARSGSFGKASIYLDKEVINSADIIIVETNKSKINPFYLVAFLNSTVGVNQLYRFASGGLQGHVNLTILENLQVPMQLKQFQSFLESVVIKAYKVSQDSKFIYQQAEDLLLSELNLKEWQPTEETIAVKSFAESYLVSDRFDAEYYQPKFDQLIERLEEKVELTRLGNLLTLNQKGRQPSYIEEDEKIEGCLPVINSKYVREGEVLLTDNRYAPLPEGDNPLTIQKNDVLFNGTGVGTVGRCAPYFYEQEALPDTEVTVLRTNLLDPVYLSIYLNSIAGKLQVQKHLQGTSGIIRVYPSDITQFLIWNAPKSVQQKIRDKVEDSHHKREQSKQLLEIAKTGVERAIETDEATATAWMNQQLEALGVELSG